MKFVQFTYSPPSKDIRVGLLENDNVLDLQKADPSLPNTLLQILQNDGDLEKIKLLRDRKTSTVPLSSVHLKAPISGVDKVLCVGLNYRDYCVENNLPEPPVPVIFSKFSSCIIGPNDDLKIRTDVTTQVDYEVELTVVIGREASNVKAEDAYKYIFGYTVAQDVSARDWQEFNGGQNLLGKAMDTFCPLGPCIVTVDEIEDPHNLSIKCKVDGVLKQDSNTRELIVKIPEIIERLSKVMTLRPGDIVLTGTPAGVGFTRKPAEFLRPGARVQSEIEGVGVLNTKCVSF